MMMAIGCIQAQRCHTNTCPVGVATQDPKRTRALDVADKSLRAYRYHEATVRQAVQIMASMGVTDPSGLGPHLLRKKITPTRVSSYAEIYEWLTPGELLHHTPRAWAADWAEASADTFHPPGAEPGHRPKAHQTPPETSDTQTRGRWRAAQDLARESGRRHGSGRHPKCTNPRSAGLLPRNLSQSLFTVTSQPDGYGRFRAPPRGWGGTPTSRGRDASTRGSGRSHVDRLRAPAGGPLRSRIVTGGCTVAGTSRSQLPRHRTSQPLPTTGSHNS